MSATSHEQKRETMVQLLDRGLVMVHLDPRVDGVKVPEWFKSDPTLRLNIAYGFNLPALDIDEEGIYAVLSFSGVDHGCNLPWESVFAITRPDAQHEGRMWPESLPPELVETMSAMAEAVEKEEAPARPQLRVVGSPEDEAPLEPSEEAPSEPSEEAPAEGAKKARPTLRLVTD